MHTHPMHSKAWCEGRTFSHALLCMWKCSTFASCLTVHGCMFVCARAWHFGLCVFVCLCVGIVCACVSVANLAQVALLARSFVVAVVRLAWLWYRWVGTSRALRGLLVASLLRSVSARRLCWACWRGLRAEACGCFAVELCSAPVLGRRFSRHGFVHCPPGRSRLVYQRVIWVFIFLSCEINGPSFLRGVPWARRRRISTDVGKLS